MLLRSYFSIFNYNLVSMLQRSWDLIRLNDNMKDIDQSSYLRGLCHGWTKEGLEGAKRIEVANGTISSLLAVGD